MEPAEPSEPSEPAEAPKRRGCRACAALLLLALSALGGAFLYEREPLPTGEAGAEAEALAGRLLKAVDAPAWARTGAVKWTFVGLHEHLWDRRRQLARVRWGEVEVLLKLEPVEGRAWRAGEELAGEEAAALVRKAKSFWINDSFWLNPVVKVRDPGTLREATAEGLLIRYQSGGDTPGDAYEWTLGPEDLPTRWKMWVQIVPVPGLDVTWEDWQTLSTGAKVARTHRILGAPAIKLSGIAGARTLEELEPGPDPFARLLD